jgi:hypothetical protein
MKYLPIGLGGLLALCLALRAAAWLVTPLLGPLTALTAVSACIYLLCRWRF